MSFSSPQFDRQLTVGQHYEAILDSWFVERGYQVYPSNAEEQRRGIDRWVLSPKNGTWASVEYKADLRAAATGNAFVEVASVCEGRPPFTQETVVRREGWAWTCEADWLLYWAVDGEEGFLYFVEPAMLRLAMAAWEEECPLGYGDNDGYYSTGLLVPLEELDAVAASVVPMIVRQEEQN